MHRTTSRFWKRFDKLPYSIKSIAEKNFQLLKENPEHPSLHFKKVSMLWSVRIGISYRALAVDDDPDFIWFWIGSHSEYDKLLSRLMD